MSFRPPRTLDAQILARADGVEAEILHEKANTLHRLAGRLERALQALRDLDGAGPADARRRERLLDDAGEALWYYVVQREVCGLHGTPEALRLLGVPREVELRMGLAPRRPAG